MLHIFLLNSPFQINSILVFFVDNFQSLFQKQIFQLKRLHFRILIQITIAKGLCDPYFGSDNLDPDFGSRIRNFGLRISRIHWEAYYRTEFSWSKLEGYQNLEQLQLHILAIIDTASKLTMSTMKLILSFSVFSTTSTVVWYIFREGGAMFPAAAKSSLDRPLMAMQCSTFD